VSTGELVSQNPALFRRFVLILAVAMAGVALLPALLALITAPTGSSYLGVQYNTDDHMVYAAWMRQAMDLRFFFDNRFTTDAQPGLTVHVYFFLLGLVAKVLGIAWTMALARAAFSAVFVMLLGRLVELLEVRLFAAKLALTLVCVGGGIGFLTWRNYGVALDGPAGGPLLGGLPIDVWQPEGFVFPSMLTNGLFMVSLCLIVWTLISVVQARNSWRPVLGGAIAFGLLMNVHSYDVLLLGLVMVGLLVMALARKQASGAWILRVGVIAVGALPAALWFMHVLREDPVFQARAATETFSPNFRQIVAGILPALLVCVAGLVMEFRADRRRLAGVGFLVAGIFAGCFLASAKTDTYWMGWPAWAAAFAWALGVLVLLAGEEPAWNLIVAWAVIALVAPYVPQLFQRKLLMAIEVPWALLAGLGAWRIMQERDRAKRNMVGALVILIFAGSSLRWFTRETMLARADVSNTTVHPVYMTPDMSRILRILNDDPARKVVLAMPGIPSRTQDPDSFASPYMPDLNPIVSGLTGAYTYAGHWSETPNYGKRRGGLIQGLFLAQTATPESQKRVLEETGATYIIAPQPSAFAQAGFADLRGLGTVVYEGNQFDLIKVR
jgi:arabinosyltransferase C